ncbi:MAG: DUF5916 domain-containing protein [Gemmatimonadales bacterium]
MNRVVGGRAGLVLAGLVFPVSVAAQTEAAPPAGAELRAAPVSVPVRLDGRLDEEAWAMIDSISDFRQREPREGEPATERTVLRLLYDRTALYVSFRCFDRDPTGIRARQLRRDADPEGDDFVTVLIDSYHDRRGAFLFGTNPNGVHYDLQLEGVDNENLDWNGIWDVATTRDTLGWTAEFRIPFHTLRFHDSDEVAFGFNARRYIRRKNEVLLWRSWGRAQGLYNLLEAGTLTGLHGIRRGRDLELRPYLLGRTAAAERSILPGGADSITLPGKTTAKAGLDARFAVTPTLTGDLTLNTDFAQVEVDRQVVNLTRFPVFFPEKREFFLESSGIFDFGRPQVVTPFYSRQIGLKSGEPVTILTGARLTGRAGRWVIGALGARTGDTDDANNVVVRAKHDLFARSYVGGIATLRSGPGVSGTEWSGGFDLDLPLVVRGKNLQPSFWITGTRFPGVSGTPLAWRIATDFPNDRLDIFASLWRVESGYHPSLGFVRRTGLKETTGHVDFMPRPKRLLGIRQFDFEFPIPRWDIIADEGGSLARSGDWQTAQFNWILLGGVFQSGDQFEFNVQRALDAPSDTFEIFRGVDIAPDRYWWTRAEVSARTSKGRQVSLDALYSLGDFYDGTNHELSLTGTWRAGGHLIASADLSRNAVRLPSGSFTAVEAGGRLAFAFNTRTELLGFVQHNNEDERVDFQLRFHWIPKTGDDVYVVWNSGYTTDPLARVRFPDGNALKRPLTGAFTVKAIHRLEF